MRHPLPHLSAATVAGKILLGFPPWTHILHHHIPNFSFSLLSSARSSSPVYYFPTARGLGPGHERMNAYSPGTVSARGGFDWRAEMRGTRERVGFQRGKDG